MVLMVLYQDALSLLTLESMNEDQMGGFDHKQLRTLDRKGKDCLIADKHINFFQCLNQLQGLQLI